LEIGLEKIIDTVARLAKKQTIKAEEDD